MGSIPAASKKMVQSLKEIVNCPEVEIYSMLKECNMDPNEAVNRLLSQDPFREVKSKREKKKEPKDVSDSRPRGGSSTSNRGGRGGADRYSSRGSTAQYGASDSGASRAKQSAHKKDNGPTVYTSPAMSMAGNNVNRQQPPLSESTMDKAFPVFIAENTSATPASSGFQSAWTAMPGQVSMADIVKMGRPHGKAPSQQHVSNQYAANPSQNRSVKLSETNPDSGVTGSQHVPPNDEWHLEEEPPATSVSSIVEPPLDSEQYRDPYDRTNQQFRSESDDVRFTEDDGGDSTHADLVHSLPGSNQNVQEDNFCSASGFDDQLHQNINSYEVDRREVEDISIPVSSVTENFQNLTLLNEEEDSTSEEDGPAVKIPDHLQVLSAECSHLSFGTFGSGIGAPFSGSLASGPVKSDEEEAPETADAPSPVGHPESRNTEDYEDEHLITREAENTAHGIGPNSGDFGATSVSQQDMLRQEAPEVPQGNQYSFPSPAANYAFENSQQLNTSFAHSQTSSQMQGLPSLMPYSNALPSTLLASTMPQQQQQQQPLRDAELAYSPFPIAQSTQTKYSNSVPSMSGPNASMAEALKNTSGAQPNQTLTGGSGPAPQQHMAVHPYSQPSLMGHFANMIMPQTYPILHQSYPYMNLPSGFQQFAAAAGNSSYPQSLAAMLPQYKNNVSGASLQQSVAVAPGYGAATFGNSNSNFPLNPPTAPPAGTSVNYDDLLSAQYKDATHLLSLQQGAGSRTMSGVPGSTYYSFQGQTQQQQPAAAFRQTQQLPSQHYGQLSGYPNFYHSQGGPTLEQQLQMSRDGSLGGSHSHSQAQQQQQQQQQPKQNPQQLWQNSY